MADEGCTQTNGSVVLIQDRTVQGLTTSSSVSPDQPTRQTGTIELTGGASLQLPTGDLGTTVAATGKSHNYDGPESSRDQPTPETVTNEQSGGTSLQPPTGDQATAFAATGNSHNFDGPKSSSYHVVIQIEDDQDPPQSASQTGGITRRRTTTNTAGPRRVTVGVSTTGTNFNADQLFQLELVLLGVIFSAAVALLIFRYQPQGDSTPPSFLFDMFGATMVCGFVLIFIKMLLRGADSTAANISGLAGIFSFAVGFLLVMGMFLPERFHWLVWAAAGILLSAFARFIAVTYFDCHF